MLSVTGSYTPPLMSSCSNGIASALAPHKDTPATRRRTLRRPPIPLLQTGIAEPPTLSPEEIPSINCLLPLAQLDLPRAIDRTGDSNAHTGSAMRVRRVKASEIRPKMLADGSRRGLGLKEVCRADVLCLHRCQTRDLPVRENQGSGPSDKSGFPPPKRLSSARGAN